MRISSVTFSIDLTQTSIIWCKIRQFTISVFPLISLSCSSMATIDQYLSTSPHVRIRQLSQIKSCHRLSLMIISVCFLYGILPIVYYEIPLNVQVCTTIDRIYKYFQMIYLLGLITTIPSSLMSLFGYLAYWNLHQTRVLAQQHAHLQLIRMVSIEIIMNLVCIIPFGVNTIYTYATTNLVKDANRLAIESFASNMIGLLSYVFYAVGTITICCFSKNEFGFLDKLLYVSVDIESISSNC